MNSLMEDIRKNSGMEVELNEGIKYFKTSEKIRKLYNKVITYSIKHPEILQEQSVKEFIAISKVLEGEFMKVEVAHADALKTGNVELKKAAKKSYDDLRQDFSKLIKIAEKIATGNFAGKKLVAAVVYNFIAGLYMGLFVAPAMLYGAPVAIPTLIVGYILQGAAGVNWYVAFIRFLRKDNSSHAKKLIKLYDKFDLKESKKIEKLEKKAAKKKGN